MQNFRVTVNGKIFEVTVEDLGQSVKTAPSVIQEAASIETSPVQEVVPSAPVAPASAAPGKMEAGDQPVNAPLSGSILSVKVKPGDSVAYGQVLLTLEALKMENEIVAPQAGVIKEIFVNAGTSVNVGDVLMSLR